ncbi:helix-turn-helix domain-containing protein [Sphingobacterium thalpophilum]|uniref:helix-turn-helix domain-containing protein n=1 Tax=Sphingobacterium thalpophilum TaxID=259 RepID=UPI0037D99908
MSQIKQLIRLKQQGYAIKAIARCLSLSKNTVKTYLFKIGQAKLNMNELLELEDPILDGLLNAVIQPIVTPGLRISKSGFPIFSRNSAVRVLPVNFSGKNISRACRTAMKFHSSVSTWGNISKYRSAARW